jgi:hypothetical protein
MPILDSVFDQYFDHQYVFDQCSIPCLTIIFEQYAFDQHSIACSTSNFDQYVFDQYSIPCSTSTCCLIRF